MIGLLFALGAAVLYAGLDLLRKLLADRLDPVTLLAWMTIGPAPAFAVWVGLSGGGWPEPGYWLPGLGSALLNVAANLCFLLSVRIAGLGSTIPLLALTPVFSSLLAVPLLGEVPRPLEGFGVVLVVAGAFWLYRGGRPGKPGEGSRRRALGMTLMVIVAVCWSAATPLDRLALRATSPALHGLVLHLVIATAMVATLAVQRRLGRLVAAAAPHAPLITATVVVGALALTCQLYALEHLWAGFVETVKRGLGSGSALLLGALVLGERLTAAQALAVGLTVVGVALVML
ncbi:MAG TPA: DMT family transporter [Thermoanaerobaculia bacterium]|nr:DMT family transporter [Thermoanaerobaculia bacterium]